MDGYHSKSDRTCTTKLRWRGEKPIGFSANLREEITRILSNKILSYGRKTRPKNIVLRSLGIDGEVKVPLIELGSSRLNKQAINWLRKFAEANRIERNDKIHFLRTGRQIFRIKARPNEFKFIDLFAGIGGIRLGFESIGGQCVFSSEWDVEAQKTYAANFGECPAGDITEIDPCDIPDHDVLVAGFPCQPFSIIGNREGFADTRGTLFFSIEQILKMKKPKFFLLENVKLFKTHDEGRTFDTVIRSVENLGYSTKTIVLNALHYGVAQRRERTFIVGSQNSVESFQFPAPFEDRPLLSDLLEPEKNLDPSLIATDYIKNKRQQRAKAQGVVPPVPSIWHENKGGHLGIHDYSCALRHNASHNYLLVNGERRLSSRECLRMQGYPESFRIVLKHRSIRAQAGNSVAVPLLEAMAAEMGELIRCEQRGISSSNPEQQLCLATK